MDTRHPRRLLALEQVLMRFSIYDQASVSPHCLTCCRENAATTVIAQEKLSFSWAIRKGGYSTWPK